MSVGCLTIEKMPQGGFVVFEGRSALVSTDPCRLCGPLFAATTMGEALTFIGNQMAGLPLAQINGLSGGQSSLARPLTGY